MAHDKVHILCLMAAFLLAPPADPTPETDEVERWARNARDSPEDADGWVRWGDALMQRSREESGSAWYDKAEAAYREALKLHPRNVGGLVGMAWVWNSRHEFEEGRRWAREALSIRADVPEAHALLGDAAVEFGEYDEAFDHYQACLDLRPDLSSYARAAQLLWLTGDAHRAKALLYKAIAAGAPHAENTAWCRAQLALMLFHTGALALAEKQIGEAAREAPENARVLAAKGCIAAARKEYGAAIKCYERALAGGDHPIRNLAALAELYEVTGESDKAAAMARRIVESHDDEHAHDHDEEGRHVHPRAHGDADLARFLADRDRDLERALREARAAYERYKNVYVADSLAWCYYKNGDLESAKVTILDALRWRTPDASFLFHAGMIHAALGEREVARKYLYRALSLNPRFHPRDAERAAAALRSLSPRSEEPQAARDDPG